MKPVSFFACFVWLAEAIFSVAIAGVPQITSTAPLIAEINQANFYQAEPIDPFGDEVTYFNDTAQIAVGDVHTYDTQTSDLAVGSISSLLRNRSEINGISISDTGVAHWQTAATDEGRYCIILRINDKFSTTSYKAYSHVFGNSEGHSPPINLSGVVPSST